MIRDINLFLQLIFYLVKRIVICNNLFSEFWSYNVTYKISTKSVSEYWKHASHYRKNNNERNWNLRYNNIQINELKEHYYNCCEDASRKTSISHFKYSPQTIVDSWLIICTIVQKHRYDYCIVYLHLIWLIGCYHGHGCYHG